ncbi:MAG: hypothetical protein BAJATHORv1_20086 [Candidatus Thorarchaeota archaeon]|nr:MAG: hypothetical protein BAJATHORv1_20086 [Candidatus Thorarchaeota archaeon]
MISFQGSPGEVRTQVLKPHLNGCPEQTLTKESTYYDMRS